MLFLIFIVVVSALEIFATYYFMYAILYSRIIPVWLKVLISAISCYPGTVLSGIFPLTGLFAVMFEAALYFKKGNQFSLFETWEPILPVLPTHWAHIYTDGIFSIWLVFILGAVVYEFRKHKT